MLGWLRVRWLVGRGGGGRHTRSRQQGPASTAYKATCSNILQLTLIPFLFLPLLAAFICHPPPLLPIVVYVFVSNRLFHLTNELKDRLVPHDDNPKLARNILQAFVTVTAALGMGWVMQRVVMLQL